ncbi:hypothetical protein RQP46_007718 [Phenoliferia psychrophenolica]
MSSSLAEDLSSYLPAIHSILATSDLSSISAKAVRKALSSQYPNLDVKANKAGIDELTSQAFQALQSNSKPASAPKPKPTKASGSSSVPPPKLKRERSLSPSASSPAYPLTKKKSSSSSGGVGPKLKEETDEEYAQKLHAELNNVRGGRSTRGGGDSGGTAKKKSTWGKKKKSNGEDGEKAPRKPSTTGFNKPWTLSDALADVVGSNVASRPQVTKQIWVYIKEHNLQKENNKMIILPDDKLKLVLPFDEVHGFQIAKHIGSHLYPYEGAPIINKDELVSDGDDDDEGEQYYKDEEE